MAGSLAVRRKRKTRIGRIQPILITNKNVKYLNYNHYSKSKIGFERI